MADFVDNVLFRFGYLRQAQKECRDAVRPSQVHPETRLGAVARTLRRPRRVSPRRHCPEPEKARKAEAETASNSTTSLTKKEIRSANITPQLPRSRNPANSRPPNVGFCQKRTAIPLMSPTKSTESAKKRHSAHFQKAASVAVRFTSTFGWKGDPQVCMSLLGNRRPEIDGMISATHACLMILLDP